MLGGARPRDAVNGPLLDFAMGSRSLDVPDIRPVLRPALVKSLDRAYKVRAGGSIIAHAAGNVLLLDPQDQGGVDALGGFDPATRSRLGRETSDTQTLLRELSASDCSTATRVSPDHSASFCQGLLARMRSLAAANNGKNPSFTILGSVPSWWEPDGTDATFVSVGGKERTIFRLHWLDGRIVGLGGHAIDNPLETPLVPVSDKTLAGFNPGAVNVVRAVVSGTTLRLQNSFGERSTLYQVR